ncbi:MAG TPA: hypothetical protein VGL71_02690, partial [Urbifossiella sp.]
MFTINRNLEHLIDELGATSCFLFVLAFIAFLAFLSALDRALKRVDHDNRRMDPALIWLNLIPIFNMLWM